MLYPDIATGEALTGIGEKRISDLKFYKPLRDSC